ncbi:o-succinylbenzoate synthase [Staphylococcus lutrae]|uniref:o-succinylbenzoate synthase n=1 Tax=Staphylococcus lutrae TaxID=155085 RepID=A0AAC9WLS8_9STAP|nr:o-succinylbenzoate synthase [Staphylococcus lutrae]ARJ50072.1 o-succinylbenzoate synthase [Staphylococcus lutrae]PNZ38356.1 o-succinylbenzoate synthase [Staphylococcus lutrae]
MRLTEMHFHIYQPSFVHAVHTPLVHMTHRPTLFVEWIDDKGHSWFGECNAFDSPWYHQETIKTVQFALISWFDTVRHQSIESFEAAQHFLTSLDETPAARATAVMAFYQMFFQLESFQVPMTLTINGDFSQRMMRFDHAGRIKMKWSDRIVEQVKLIATMYPDIPISIDANQSLTAAHMHDLKALKSYLAYIEEPFEVLDATLPFDELPMIAIDEHATCIERILYDIEHQHVQVVVLKPFRLGGIDRTLEIMQRLQKEHVKIVIGGMYECGLSRYFTAWLSQWGDYAGDVSPEGYYFDRDICENSGRLKHGQLYFEPPVVHRSLLHEESE